MDSVLKYAKNHGYEKIINRGKWKEYTVYEMVLSEKEFYIGIPQYILKNGKNLKISDADEAFEIMDWLDNKMG